MTEQKATAVTKVEKDIFTSVMAKVKDFQNKGEIVFPADYIPENALKAAQLKLYEVQDKNYKPALEVCTQPSIANALLSTVIQGLNPDKKQCYYIVRGTKLCMDRSYFGDVHVAKTVNPEIVDIIPKTVFEGDETEVETFMAKDKVIYHKSNPFERSKDKIKGAYCNVIFSDGSYYSVIMTFEQIKQSWNQSQMKPVNEDGSIKKGSTHEKFTIEMCERTITRKACTPIINKSSDKNLVAKFARQSDMDSAEAELAEEVDNEMCSETIDVSEAVDVESQPVNDSGPEPEPEKPQNGPNF